MSSRTLEVKQRNFRSMCPKTLIVLIYNFTNETDYVQVLHLFFFFWRLKGQAVVHADYLYASARAQVAIKWYLCCINSPAAHGRTL